jgi:hypothetical protein
MRKISGLLIFALATLLFSVPLFAQGNLGRITGGVTDQTGGAVSGATVTVLDVQRGVSRASTTDSAGQYFASNLIPGQYEIQVEAAGFNKFVRQNIPVEVGQEVRIDAVLTPGSQTQTVTVTEQVPTITTTNATMGGVIENQALTELPLSGRNFLHLLDQKPGIQMRPGGGPNSYISNGQRNNGNGWMLDGLFSGNVNTGASPVLGGGSGAGGPEQANVLPVDAIQEINVQQDPKAEYGYKPGANINIGLKSGTNSFHGSAYAFGRDQSLEAKNAFLSTKQPTEVEQWGVSTGGPIKKDKLFFFGNFEKQDFSIAAAKTATVPTATVGAGPTLSFPEAIAAMNAASKTVSQLSLNLAGCTNPTPLSTIAANIPCNASKGIFGNSGGTANEVLAFPVVGGSNNFVAKADYNLNDKNTIHGEFVFGDGVPTGQSGTVVQPYWRGPYHIRSQVARAMWVWAPNSAWVNEARFGWDNLLQNADAGDCYPSFGAPDISALGWNSGVPLCGFGTVSITGFTSLGSALGSHSQPTYFQGEDSVSRTLGKHVFKFGGGIRSVDWAGSRTNPLRGTIAFTSLQNFLAGTPNPSSTANSIAVGNPNQNILWNSYWTYFQDDWRLTPKITLNLGLRWEFESPMSDSNGNAGGFDPNSPSGLFQQKVGQGLWRSSKNDWSPRLGIAWDVKGNGTTVVRAGGGIFYEPFITQLVSTQQAVYLVPTGAILTGYSGASPGNIKNGTISVTAAQIAANWFPNTPIFGTIPTSATPTCSNASPCALGVIDPGLKPAIVGEWNIDVQHAISGSMSFDIAYVANHSEWGTGGIDQNQPTPGLKASEQANRPYNAKFPYLGQISTETANDRSNYQSLQASFTKRVSHGLSFTSAYTFGHSLDIHSLDGAANPKGVMDSTRPYLDYGSSDLDFRHRLTLGGTYLIPGKKSPGQMLEGWQLNTAVTLLSGQPMGAFDTSSDLSGTGEQDDRWNLFGKPTDFTGVGTPQGLPCYGITGSAFAKPNCTTEIIPAGATTALQKLANMPTACVNAATNLPTGTGTSGDTNATGLQALANFGCYAQGSAVIVPPAQGTYGNMPRNSLFGRQLHVWDLSVTKNWKIKERITAQFRVEIFNVINTVNYSIPTGTSGTNPAAPATFGISSGTPDVINNAPVFGSGGPRKIQLGAKFIF